jgi:hypothetical protein
MAKFTTAPPLTIAEPTFANAGAPAEMPDTPTQKTKTAAAKPTSTPANASPETVATFLKTLQRR